jgi:hypothetical protein
MMKIAAEKTHEIRQAYETISRARGPGRARINFL